MYIYKVKLIDLRLERWQVVRFRKSKKATSSINCKFLGEE